MPAVASLDDDAIASGTPASCMPGVRASFMPEGVRAIGVGVPQPSSGDEPRPAAAAASARIVMPASRLSSTSAALSHGGTATSAWVMPERRLM